MAGKIQRRLHVALPDDPSAAVSADEWNDSLIVTEGTDGQLLVRDSAAADGWTWQMLGSAGLPLPMPADAVFANSITVGGATHYVQLKHDGTNVGLVATDADVLTWGPSAAMQWAILGGTGTLIPWAPDNTLDIGRPGNQLRSGYFGTSLSVGTTPAQGGAIRLANNQAINARNAANTTDVPLILASDSDGVVIGNELTYSYINGGNLIVNPSGVPYPKVNNSTDLGWTGGRWRFGFFGMVDVGLGPITGRMFCEDNGAGKTRLMVQFATGAAQQIAIEP